MTLTRGGGPLSTPHPSDVNYEIDGPKHLLLSTAFPRRVRASIGGAPVVDTEGAVLLHESNLHFAVYLPQTDLSVELEPTDTTSHCPFKGDASYWTINGVKDAAWSYEDPLRAAAWLKGLIAFYPDKVDAWWDEDEQVQGLRDPYHRCDVRPRGDVMILSETGMPNREYVPRESVTAELERSETTSHCPYKGDATYWHVDGNRDAAWSYEAPYGEVLAIVGHLCFAD